VRLLVNLLLLAAAVAASPAAAQGFKPSRPVEFIVHGGPGSGVDVTARFVNGVLEKEKLLPVRALVVNKPGGGGAVAAAFLAEKKGDVHIPFPGGGERVAAVLGGHANIYFTDAQEVREYLRNGSMRPIAQMGDRRMPEHPGVPTVQEAGYGIPIVRSMRGVVAPPGIPGDAAEYWENVFERMVKTETWRKYLADNQVEDGFQKGADLARSAQEFIAQRREIFREAGIPMYR